MSIDKFQFTSWAAIILACAQPIHAQVLTHRAIWYRPAQINYVAQIANPTTRSIALQTLDQNFYGFALNNYANEVIIRISDNDAQWGGNGGGGFPYNPTQSAGQFAQAQELIVELAQKYSMKVIFCIDISSYHRYVAGGDLFNAKCDPACGAYAYIHSVIDSTYYYGTQTVTGGGVVGLADPTHTRSLINDSRVAGWILGIEWDFDSAETNYYNADHAFLTKYWQFFWSTVHYNGANSSFATLYPKGTPSDGNNDSNCSDTSGRLSYENTNLQGMMTFFKSQSSSPPDLFMAEWYGVGNYPLACIGNDVASLITGTASLGRGIGLSRGVLLAEGGTNETSNSTAAKQFMENAINAAATNGGAGFAGPWDSDGLIDLMYTPTCPANVKTATPTSLYTANGFDPTGQGVLNSGAINYSLATEYMAYNFAGCISLFASPPPGYHYLAGSDPTLASSYQVLTQNWLTAYGTQYWNSETSEGAGVSSAFCKHSKSPPPSNCPAP